MATAVTLHSPAEGQGRFGTIRGLVVDQETRQPVAGVNITVVGTALRAASGQDGRYAIAQVPVGAYSLQFAIIGYRSIIKPDVIVRPQRVTMVEEGLQRLAVELEEVVVLPEYFVRHEVQPTSVTEFSSEEIRRAPGSAGDVSRILMVLPSIAKVNDQTNNLVVRGGSPAENAFYIDNIEIPNINHWPTQGASGGPIGILNVDFIQDVEFSAGGFGAQYGDRLSSVMDLTFREGNRSEFDGQLDLNFAGAGATAEGPLSGGRGSWLASARRSYLDLLVKMVDLGTAVVPVYNDYQAKLVYDLGPNHQITALGILGDDHNSPDRETAIDNDMIVYGNQDILEATGGVNWRALWTANGMSNTSLSYTSTDYAEDFFETTTANQLLRNRSVERAVKLRNASQWRLGDRHSLAFGAEGKVLIADYDNRFAAYTDALGQPVLPMVIAEHATGAKLGAFASYTRRLAGGLTATLGGRLDYTSLTENLQVSPRASLAFGVSERTSVNAAAGVYRQGLPLVLLTQSTAHRDLREPLALHYVVGLDHLLASATRLKVEAYYKAYYHFPIDPAEPTLFLIDELYYRYGFFFNHERLTDEGRAYSSGVELSLQKRLAQRFYGLASASYFRTRYRDSAGVWRDRVFDNRVILSVEGGYKPSGAWEASLRWIYGGGTPYTPFDESASAILGRAVLDAGRINQERYPAYHSLNLRVDRRFNFAGSNLTAYLSVWNAYNRKNVASYFWNEIENRPDVTYQWTLLPVFGLEYEF